MPYSSSLGQAGKSTQLSIGGVASASPVSITGTTAASTSLTDVTPTTGYANGAPITGTGIPAGTTIVSGAGTATLVLSQAATNSVTETLVVGIPYIAVSEIDDIPDFIPEWKMADTTNLNSSMEEMKPTILGTKKVSLQGNRVSSDAGQAQCQTAYAGSPPVPYWFKIVLPINTAAGQSTSGDTWVFSAYVTKCGPKDVKASDWIKTAIDLTMVSAPVFTEGA